MTGVVVPMLLRENRMPNTEYEYGFYDSHPDGNWREPPKPQENPTIYWYVFGFLTHPDAESAEHTGAKSANGQAIIVRRVKGQTDWEHYTAPASSTPNEGTPNA